MTEGATTISWRDRAKLAWRRITLARRKLVVLALAGVALLWLITPAFRAVTLVANPTNRSVPHVPSDLPIQSVQFDTADGVRIAGWFVLASPHAPTIILVHGFKSTRNAMLPWARFVYHAGYNVLLYDSRGCGQSGGWHITLGAREPDDVLGAITYLRGRADLAVKRFGALGISLGAGVALLAAARSPDLTAVVADSAWPDETPQIARMDRVSVGPLALPLPPYEPALVDALIGARLADVRPAAMIAHIAPRAVMLIHSADDQNTLTPLVGERVLFAAAQQPKAEWIAPSGGHTGALAAYPTEYQRRVLAFFALYLPLSA